MPVLSPHRVVTFIIEGYFVFDIVKTINIKAAELVVQLVAEPQGVAAFVRRCAEVRAFHLSG